MLMTKDYDPVSKLSSLVFSLNVPPAIYCEPGATWFFTDAPETVMQIKEMATRYGLTNVLTLVDHKYKSKGYFSVVVRKSTKHHIGCGCKWLAVSEPNYGKYQKSIIFEFADDGHAFRFLTMKYPLLLYIPNSRIDLGSIQIFLWFSIETHLIHGE